MAFTAAATLPGLAAVVGYDAHQVRFFADQAPRCPTLLHLAAEAEHLQPEHLAQIRRLRGHDCTVHLYEQVGHGFHRDAAAGLAAEAAALAWQRTLAWLQTA